MKFKADFLNSLNESNMNRMPKVVKDKANKIVNRYNGWRLPEEIRPMWSELEELDITNILISGYPHENSAGSKSWCVEFDYKGERCDNSMFIYSIYEGSNSLKNEYNMYFS